METAIMTELEEIAGQRFDAMKYRFGARYTKDGRCYRPKLELPFSRRQFTEWFSNVLATGTTRCIYCNWPVNLHTIHIDHRTPVCQGGSLELYNLAPTCAECNMQKGELTEGAFLELRALITNHPKFAGITDYKFTEHDTTDIKARLQSQLKLARWKQGQIRRQTEKVRIVPHRREAG